VSNFVIGFVCAAVVPVFLRWMMRRARHEVALQNPTTGEIVMKPSRGFRAFMLGSALFFFCLTAGTVYFAMPYWKLALAFATFFLVPSLVVLNELRRSVVVSNAGVVSNSPWKGTRSAGWGDIESVRFREWGQTIRMKLKDGGSIAVPCSLSGVSQLELYMRQHLSIDVFGDTFNQYEAYLAAR
jgi:hypothetical protein